MTLLSVIKKDKYKRNQVKVLVLGLDNSGKTSILYNIIGKKDVIIPTIGFNIVNFKEDKVINFWDIGGQLQLRNFWFNYFNDKFDKVMWIIDLVGRYEENLLEFNKVKEYLVNLELIVVLNKSDLYEGDIEKFKQKVIEDMKLDELKLVKVKVFVSSIYEKNEELRKAVME